MLFEVLFFVSIFIIFFGEFLYPKMIFLLAVKPVKKSVGLPQVTILIPAYNEGNIIAEKIKNTFFLDYPAEKREIVVIDNNSTDKTYEIAGEFPVTLLKSARGKINALNEGISYAKTEVIIMTDADVLLAAESVKSAVSFLGEEVGAVTGYVVASATVTGKNFLMKDKEKYKKKDWELRYQEGLVDSVCNLDGKFIAFRKSIFSGFPQDALVDDYFMTFAIRGKGYRLIVDKSAEVYEKLEENATEEISQFKRYVASILILNFRNIRFLFNPKYGYFGFLTFPFRRFFPVLYPFFLSYAAGFLMIAGVEKISRFSVSTAIFIYGLATLFLLSAMLFLWFCRRFALIRLLAVFSAYVDFFRENDLKLGQWSTASRKK